jgi:hypothetical protein
LQDSLYDFAVRNLTVQKVFLALIAMAFFVASPWLISELLNGNSYPLLTLVLAGLLLFFLYGLGDRCWLIIPFCLSIEGNLNFLPLNFSIQELAIIVVFLYLFFRMIFGLDVAWRLGPAILWVPLAGLLVVILFHWIESRDIGIRLLGGSGWGGRKYFKVMLASLAIPLLASFPGIRSNDLQKVPLIYFLGSLVDIVPEAISTMIPATAPYIWRVYSGVNIFEYGSTLLGNFGEEAGVSRLGALAKIGTATGIAALCYFPPRTWLRYDRLWVSPFIFLGGLICAASGFRNNVVRYFLSVMAGLYTTVRLRALLILPLGVMAAFAVALTQGKVFDYPLAMQRGLSFLPGDWNAKAKGEADDSSKWRQKMKALFYKEYFSKAPLLGLGYHYDPELAKRDTDIYLSIVARKAEQGDEYADVRSFIEQRQPHEGLVHALLVSGIVGTFFFSAYCLGLLLFCFRGCLRTPPNKVTPIQIWAGALLFSNVGAFFLLGGDYSTFLITTCPISTLLFCYERTSPEGKGSSPYPPANSPGFFPKQPTGPRFPQNDSFIS